MRAAAVIIVLLAGTAAEARGFRAEIVRTAHGIPHITAPDFAGLGYGVAYAYGQDNLCLLAEEFATVEGTRSLHFGPAGSATLGFQTVDNVSSDVFFRSTLDLPALKAQWRRAGARERDLFTGFAAGWNRLLRDLGPARVPEACRGKPWVRPITTDDLLRLNEKQMLLAGSLVFAPAIANAAPPSGQTALNIDIPTEMGLGSNGWAFGADSTANGRGLVVGNPHFPWFGSARFWQMHTTVPGMLDVMGVGIGGTPFPSLGFNKHVAWTHTVTAARHFTIHALTLDAADPMTYIVDGRPENMTAQTISVPVPAGAQPIPRTVYASRFGPMVMAPAAGLGWSKTTAYALKEANRGNQRGLTAWLGIATARSTADIRQAVETTLGIPWVNTIAADSAGNALLADVTAVPNVSADQIKACATPLSPRVAARFVLLDGSKSSCDWTAAKGTPVAGLMPATAQAVFARRDWVANSNDSYWLTTPKAPATPLSPILGSSQTVRTHRTRSGLLEIERNHAAGKMTPETTKTMAFANKSLAAELALPALITLAESDPALGPAATALKGWDQRFDNSSRGAFLFHHIWMAAQNIPGLWATPFSVADPVNTPHTLVTSGEQSTKLKAIIAKAMADVRQAGFALDAPWGDVQWAPRGGEKIAIHGGEGDHGVLNVQRSMAVPGGLNPVHGTSYIQVVTFDETGPVADAVLSYSQSTDPASPWYGDQTRQYSAKQWNRLPFTKAEIAATQVGEVLRLRE
ncbi:aculeacin A acylase [Polymorphobacter multimanifer]|nr:aculeacin A acylase [Polymorphobacter multimanifer]